MESSITLRILSRNRREFLGETLSSVFSQEEPFAGVELYDNASDFDVHDLTGKFPLLKIRRLPKPVPVEKNLRRALSDPPSTPFLCVFHDDDVFDPDFTLCLKKAARKYPEAAALSCNGTVIDACGNREHLLLPMLEKDLILQNPADLARWYCDGFVPFPPIIYRWNERLGHELDGCHGFGRCVDVAFLGKIVTRAPIVVLAKPHFLYRRHPQQDSEGFQWWEETKRWQLQAELCRDDPVARQQVERKRNDRHTSRWLNAWLKNEPRHEPFDGDRFSLASAYRFGRNNKLRILRRLLFGRGMR